MDAKHARIDVASSSDLRGAADVAVRSLRWTKGVRAVLVFLLVDIRACSRTLSTCGWG